MTFQECLFAGCSRRLACGPMHVPCREAGNRHRMSSLFLGREGRRRAVSAGAESPVGFRGWTGDTSCVSRRSIPGRRSPDSGGRAARLRQGGSSTFRRVSSATSMSGPAKTPSKSRACAGSAAVRRLNTDRFSASSMLHLGRQVSERIQSKGLPICPYSHPLRAASHASSTFRPPASRGPASGFGHSWPRQAHRLKEPEKPWPLTPGPPAADPAPPPRAGRSPKRPWPGPVPGPRRPRRGGR